ncbi:nitronate monooxygenase [Actinokineospora enzanensis]|uniref:nitronate monooxygenase n=1 Tax=Actinokineospora enzanensis TaxID=155975 RepID=UPI0003A3D6F8|nr:nitronate monooxygenase [Actinokineospora enzanensis]
MITKLAVPIIVAPMAGGVSTPALVAGAVAAGAYAFLPAGYLTPEAFREQVEQTKALTGKPFGVNLFTPGARSTADTTGYRDRVRAQAERLGVDVGEPRWDDDHYAAKVDIVVAAKIPVVSFTFGLPSAEDVRRLKAVGSTVVATVTTPAEARAAAERGADVLCVQGAAAGAHRGAFENDAAYPGGAPLYDLLPAMRVIGTETGLPLIAAGGLTHGADVAAVLAAGAVAAQLGTAFLLCPEAGTSEAHRKALVVAERETTLTRAFTGRPARGLVNSFIAEHQDAPNAYPDVHHVTKPVRVAAGRAGDPEAMALWAGQAYPLAVEAPVAEVIGILTAQARDAVAALTRRWPVAD